MLSDLEPSLADEGLEWSIWQSRLAATPSAAAEWIRMAMETDIVDTLSSIKAPTLVLFDRSTEEQAHLICVRVRDSKALATESAYDDRALQTVLEFLRGDPLPVVPDSVLATVLFTDLVGSTEQAARLGDRAWRDVLVRHHADVRTVLARYRGKEVDTAGDGFFCRVDGPARAIACAHAIVEQAHAIGLDVRAGVHIGECELVGDKLAGIAVVTGSRISALAVPGEVLVSNTVKDLVAGSGFDFVDRGEHELKGVPGTLRLYAVSDG
jgi:class 3 adenylate cyclase